jgi:hypothetical protein
VLASFGFTSFEGLWVNAMDGRMAGCFSLRPSCRHDACIIRDNYMKTCTLFKQQQCTIVEENTYSTTSSTSFVTNVFPANGLSVYSFVSSSDTSSFLLSHAPFTNPSALTL